MTKIIITLIVLSIVFASFQTQQIMSIQHSFTFDSLGACQGASYQGGNVFLYGDREVGMIRKYRPAGDSLQYTGEEMRLTLNDTDVINHPTGIAYHEGKPVFIGNSIRLNKEGTLWRAVIYCLNWKGLQSTHTLDGNLLNTVEDDACIQGTRPEYVQYKGKWYVATADYGNKDNEVRLYDAEALRKAKKTTDKGVLYKKFTCTPWVQNMYWMDDKGILLLIQNQVEGKQWRFTYLNLEESIRTGKQVVIKEIDVDRNDELEGFTYLPEVKKGIAVSSSRKNNVNLMETCW